MSSPRQSETLVEFLMTMSGLVCSIAIGVYLRKTTSLPFWACVLISLPIGVIAGWAIILGLGIVLYAVISIFQKK